MGRCRFCYVEENKEFLRDIFNNGPAADITIAKIAEMLTDLSIRENDPYTKLSCLDCFDKLIDFYHCRETILKTNQLLIKSEINNNCNKSEANINRDYHEQSILADDIEENIRNESDGEDQRIYEKHLNISMDNETTIDANKNNFNNDDNDIIIVIIDGVDGNNNQRSDKNNLCTDESHGFISKDEIDVEETPAKIVVENDFNNGDQQIENYHHPSLSTGGSNDEPIISDNKDYDGYCSDIVKDGSSIKECPSIIDIGSNKDRNIQKDNSYSKNSIDIGDNKTANSDNIDKNLVMNQQNDNKKHLRHRYPTCSICNKICWTKTRLTVHLRTHRREERHQCHICGKTVRRRDIKQHLLTHTDVKTHQCNICDKTFSSKNYLSVHLNIHTDEKTHECHICDKTFLTKSSLKQHLLIHTGEKPHQCHICGKKSSIKSSLKIHLLSHNTEKSHQCHICDKKFILKSNLRRHLLIHNVEESYQCDTCGKKFMRKGYLKQHLLTHASEKSYQCIICSKTFTMKHHLKRHLLIHTNETR